MKSKGIVTLITALALTTLCASSYAYDFWGVQVGTELYQGNAQLTFDGLTDKNIRYTVGGYKYTRVDGDWKGSFAAPSPGEGFLSAYRSDAQGLFYRADTDAAKFVVVCTSNQNGLPAPDVNAGTRLFGPGDLKIDIADRTYGIGLRLDNLLWAADPSTTNPEYLIYGADGSTRSITSRDAGTLGEVELNPQWARVGHANLAAGSDAASAFFIDGTGTSTGSATVNYIDTGLRVNGARVYAYEVSVPWSALGISYGDSSSLSASWRPDCGNDVISLGNNSSTVTAVPEPTGAIALGTGVIGLIGLRRK